MLGLFYDGTGNEIGTEMALIEANKINMANALAELKSLKEVYLYAKLIHMSNNTTIYINVIMLSNLVSNM